MSKEKIIRVSQLDIPLYSIKDALIISKSIIDEFAGDPTPPLEVAISLDVGPNSTFFRDKCGASIAYGLTKGGYNSAQIAILELARQVHQPVDEEEDIKAIVESITKPKILNQFYTKYNKSKFPSDRIALNVLEQFGTPKKRLESTLALIKENASFAGIIKKTKTGDFLLIEKPERNNGDDGSKESNGDSAGIADEEMPEELRTKLNFSKNENDKSDKDDGKAQEKNLKVFISHGKNKKVVEQLKEILKFGQFEPVVSVEKETTAIPVPEKVFQDMRQCSFGVLHVEGEIELMDADGNKIKKINDNVLIEIGAAIALYDKKFILLCEKSLELPSNLQGLYRLNYEGSELNYESTMKLLKTFNEFR